MKRTPLQQPGAQISKAPSALSNIIFKTKIKYNLFVNPLAHLSAWDRSLQCWLGISWFPLETDDLNGSPESLIKKAQRSTGKVIAYMAGSDHSGVTEGQPQSGGAKLRISTGWDLPIGVKQAGLCCLCLILCFYPLLLESSTVTCPPPLYNLPLHNCWRVSKGHSETMGFFSYLWLW